MNGLEQRQIQCPYCGESLSISIDCSVPYQQYIEDCQVCCRPMLIDATIENNDIRVTVRHENE